MPDMAEMMKGMGGAAGGAEEGGDEDEDDGNTVTAIL
jgi:hypothetical protein